ncbi:MAG: peptidase M28, partial [Sphingobacteriia bacterium 32-37-4]
MNKLIGSSIALILFASCTSNQATFSEEDGLSVFNADTLKKHIAVLASDDFKGRKPFTEGETKTVAYLQAQFKQMGLEPGNGDSYIQEVPMANILATAAPSMQVKSAKGTFNLKAFDDYIIWTDKTDSSISLNNADLVFA